jgi:RNA polymerase sigma-70 factor (ECF subfamily)
MITPRHKSSISPTRSTGTTRRLRPRGGQRVPLHVVPATPEKEIIALAQRGDSAAFEIIYRRHSARIYAVCLRIAGNTAEAEDLTQDAFVQVLRKIRSFRGDSAFSTWLHRIAVNLALMRLRRKPSREVSLEETTGEQSEAAPRKELVAPDPELAGFVDRVHIQRALANLRPAQKLVVELHDIQGYQHNEIARMLDWTVGNSKSQLHRARTRLRKALQPQYRPDRAWAA